MDDETREAMEMTPEELAARWAKGEQAKVRKRDDFVQRMKSVVDESVAKSEEVDVMRATITADSVTRRVEQSQLDEVAARLHLDAR